MLGRIKTDKSPEAHVLLLSTLAHAKLLFGDLEGTQNDMELAWKVLDNLDGVDPAGEVVSARGNDGQCRPSTRLFSQEINIELTLVEYYEPFDVSAVA